MHAYGLLCTVYSVLLEENKSLQTWNLGYGSQRISGAASGEISGEFDWPGGTRLYFKDFFSTTLRQDNGLAHAVIGREYQDQQR